jgi:predicted  nucleic acid-binding Zn-ribbon protein
MENAATALADRDATIERLTKVAEQAQEDRRTLRYEVACLRERATTAERERDEARAEVERLKLRLRDAFNLGHSMGERFNEIDRAALTAKGGADGAAS